MGQITATNGTITRDFTCEQYALGGYALPSGWTVTENTCGVYFTKFRSPYASFGIEFNGTSLPGSWHTYKGTIASNKVIIPTTIFLLPSNYNNSMVIVRRQVYHASEPGETRDFTLNYTDNSVDFESGLGLNGQIAFVKVFK